MGRPRTHAVALLCAAGTGVLAGCAAAAPAPAPDVGRRDLGGQISVAAGDAVCEVSSTTAPAGALLFVVTNTGGSPTAFALYDAADRVMGTVDDIAPGQTRELAVAVPASGAYTTACRPGQVGDGIRAPFTVTGAPSAVVDADAALAAASADYRRYLTAQLDALVVGTQEFAAAVAAGRVDRAKALFSAARAPYERIEPLATPFADLAVRIDGQEDDERDPTATWVGFHRLEKDLWADGLRPDSRQVADQLVADTAMLRTRLAAVPLDAPEVGATAKELLDEVAISKIAGDEDRYAHTDLADLAANVEGSRAAVAALRPVLDARDAPLGVRIDQQFAAVESLLLSHRAGAGYVSSTALTDPDRKRMADAIDALGEPVSTVAGIITS